MRIRSFAVGGAVLLLGSFMLASVALAAERQIAPMGWHPQTGQAGLVGSGAEAALVRRADGVSFKVTTSSLRPGHAYTVWFVVINHPEACAASPCNAQDILLNPATASQITYGAGHVSGNSGRAGFGGAFRVGPLDGWLPAVGLENPLTAEVQVVVNDHGTVLSAFLPDMIQTYRAGCTDASLPAIFPASAKADGEPGPNACQLYQAAVFPAP
jgi:hypothetical protein